MDDDLALLERWRQGDAAAGNALLRRHLESIHRFFLHKVDGDADELVQETLLACVNGRDRFRGQSSFRTYLFGIARNVLYAHWRQRAARRELLDFDQISVASLSTSAGGRLARGEDRARLLAALRELPLEQQLLLELHYWEQLERAQLAEVFGVEEATTRSRLHRARQALRERLAAGRSVDALGDDELDAWACNLHTAEPPDDDPSQR